MKNTFTLILGILLLSSVSLAQTKIIVSGLNDPRTISMHNGDLLICESTSGEILRVDLDLEVPITESILTGLVNPNDITVIGDTLYILETDNSRILKADLSANPISAIEYVAGLTLPSAMTSNGNDLFYYELTEKNISKVDVTMAPTPQLIYNFTDFIPPLSLNMLVRENIIYMSDMLTGEIKLVDLDAGTNSVFMGGLTGPTAIEFKGDELHIIQSVNNLISKVDINDPGKSIVDLVTGLEGPSDIYIDGEYIYISENTSKVLSRYPQDEILANNLYAIDFSFFPNPASEFIKVTVTDINSSYKIYREDGVIVRESKLEKDGNIDIKDLKNGLYFLSIDNSKAKTFIKE